MIVNQLKLAIDFVYKELRLHFTSTDSIDLQLIKIDQSLATLLKVVEKSILKEIEFMHLDIALQ